MGINCNPVEPYNAYRREFILCRYLYASARCHTAEKCNLFGPLDRVDATALFVTLTLFDPFHGDV